MKLKKKVYTSRREKIKDFAIGAAIFIGMNFILLIFSIALTRTVAGLIESPRGLIGELYEIVFTFSCAITLLSNVAFMVYFGLIRAWIGIGMVGTFVILLLLWFLLGVWYGIVYIGLVLLSRLLTGR